MNLRDVLREHDPTMDSFAHGLQAHPTTVDAASVSPALSGAVYEYCGSSELVGLSEER